MFKQQWVNDYAVKDVKIQTQTRPEVGPEKEYDSVCKNRHDVNYVKTEHKRAGPVSFDSIMGTCVLRMRLAGSHGWSCGPTI